MLDKECLPGANATAEALEDWSVHLTICLFRCRKWYNTNGFFYNRYKAAQTVYLQSQILDKDLNSADLKLRALGFRMKEAVPSIKEQFDTCVNQVKSKSSKN